MDAKMPGGFLVPPVKGLKLFWIGLAAIALSAIAATIATLMWRPGLVYKATEVLSSFGYAWVCLLSRAWVPAVLFRGSIWRASVWVAWYLMIPVFATTIQRLEVATGLTLLLETLLVFRVRARWWVWVAGGMALNVLESLAYAYLSGYAIRWLPDLFARLGLPAWVQSLMNVPYGIWLSQSVLMVALVAWLMPARQEMEKAS